MLKVILIGLVAVFTALLLREKKPEYAMAVSLGACTLILLFAVLHLSTILSDIRRIVSYLNLPDSYYSILIKIVGISFLAEFGSALCKDAGQSAIAGSIELVGKLVILAVSMPVITSLFDTIKTMVL